MKVSGLALMLNSSAAHSLGALRDGADDVVVAGATTEVTVEPLADLGFGAVSVVVHEVDRAHDHARRAEPALQSETASERLLHRVQRAVRGCDAFDRRDFTTGNLRDEYVA